MSFNKKLWMVMGISSQLLLTSCSEKDQSAKVPQKGDSDGNGWDEESPVNPGQDKPSPKMYSLQEIPPEAEPEVEYADSGNLGEPQGYSGSPAGAGTSSASPAAEWSEEPANTEGIADATPGENAGQNGSAAPGSSLAAGKKNTYSGSPGAEGSTGSAESANPGESTNTDGSANTESIADATPGENADQNGSAASGSNLAAGKKNTYSGNPGAAGNTGTEAGPGESANAKGSAKPAGIADATPGESADQNGSTASGSSLAAGKKNTYSGSPGAAGNTGSAESTSPGESTYTDGSANTKGIADATPAETQPKSFKKIEKWKEKPWDAVASGATTPAKRQEILNWLAEEKGRDEFLRDLEKNWPSVAKNAGSKAQRQVLRKAGEVTKNLKPEEAHRIKTKLLAKAGPVIQEEALNGTGGDGPRLKFDEEYLIWLAENPSERAAFLKLVRKLRPAARRKFMEKVLRVEREMGPPTSSISQKEKVVDAPLREIYRETGRVGQEMVLQQIFQSPEFARPRHIELIAGLKTDSSGPTEALGRVVVLRGQPNAHLAVPLWLEGLVGNKQNPVDELNKILSNKKTARSTRHQIFQGIPKAYEIWRDRETLPLVKTIREIPLPVGNPMEMRYQLRALAALGDSSYRQKFLKDLKEKPAGPEKEEAAYSLSYYRDKDTIEKLIEYTDTDDNILRSYAAHPLTQMGKSAQPQLVKALKNGSQNQRIAAAFALGEMRLSENAEPLLNAFLDSSGGAVRDQLREALGSQPGEWIIKRLVEVLKEEEDSDRKNDIARVLIAQGPRVTPYLKGELTSPDNENRWAAVMILGNTRSEAVLPDIKNIARSDEIEYVRVAAVRVLGLYKNKTSELGPLLMELAGEDEAAPVVAAALVSLGRMRYQPAMLFVKEKRLDPVWKIRRDCARALGLFGKKDNLPVLKEMLEDNHPNVRAEVEKAIQRLNRKTGTGQPSA